jgi:hypothetical protein
LRRATSLAPAQSICVSDEEQDGFENEITATFLCLVSFSLAAISELAAQFSIRR